MHIGIDLDGVLADLNGQTVNGYNSLFPNKDPIKLEDLNNWNYLVNERGLSRKVQTEIFNRVWRNWKTLPTVEDATLIRVTIQKLKEAGHIISVVTHRHPYTHTYVPQWLHKNGILYDNLMLVSGSTTLEKHQLVDILIDDHPRVVEIAADYPNTLVLLRDQPWNRYITTNNNTARILSLTEVPLFVSSYAQTRSLHASS